MALQKTSVKLSIKHVFANGDERCELRWTLAADPIYSAVKDWSLVRDVKFEMDSATGDAVLSFTRTSRQGVASSSRRRRIQTLRPRLRIVGGPHPRSRVGAKASRGRASGRA
jgi:hypothetical protein